MTQPQHMMALARANEIRFARVDAKHDIYAGRLGIADALVLECCQTMLVRDLLMARRRWGLSYSRKLLLRIGMSESKTVGSLTERQRGILIAAVGETKP